MSMIKVHKVLEEVAVKENRSINDVLQQLLEKEMQKRITGQARVRFLIDGGFEGEVKVDVTGIHVKADRDGLRIFINGCNGELEIEIENS
jgi:hypothetical protein